MKILTYLFFDGNCREAFERYAQVLGGEIANLVTYGQIPGAADSASRDLVMHAFLRIGEQGLMGSDTGDHAYEAPAGCCVSFHTEDLQRAREIFEALAQGGRVTMAFEETEWSPGFGQLIDAFGVPWMVNTEVPMPAG